MMIRSINELEYMIAFDGYRSAYSDRCVRESLNEGVLLGAEKDGRLAGYLCVIKDGRSLRVLYSFTLPQERRCGVLTELLHALTDPDMSERFDVQSIRVNISATHEYHSAVTSACLKQGFLQAESVIVFTCRRDRDDHWKTFMEEKGEKMCDLLHRWGYEAVSFNEASDDLRVQLYDPESHGYGSTFNVAAYLSDPAKKIAADMSFAAVLDGRLAAYTLVTRDSSDAVVFQIISDAEWARGSGVILLPFVQSMKKFYDGDYKTALYAMYSSNKDANAFRNSALGGFYTESSETQNYYYIYK